MVSLIKQGKHALSNDERTLPLKPIGSCSKKKTSYTECTCNKNIHQKRMKYSTMTSSLPVENVQAFELMDPSLLTRRRAPDLFSSQIQVETHSQKNQQPQLLQHLLPAECMPCYWHDLHEREPVSLHFLQSSCSPCICSFQSIEYLLGSIHSTF